MPGVRWPRLRFTRMTQKLAILLAICYAKPDMPWVDGASRLTKHFHIRQARLPFDLCALAPSRRATHGDHVGGGGGVAKERGVEGDELRASRLGGNTL